MSTQDVPSGAGFDYQNDTWTVVDQMLGDSRVLIKHHTDSFNHFVEHLIPIITSGSNPITFETGFDGEEGEYTKIYEIYFENVRVSKPVIKLVVHSIE